jgi:6-phospho-beta-glucosidase
MLAESCRLIVEACPEAWVLNLVNPLSITTTRMVQAGVKRCIGVCELPRVTMRKAAAVLDRDPERAEWAYTGLNHRGFITRLAWNGKNRIDEVSGLLGEAALDGISAAEIANLEAVPTKYFRLLSDRPGPARGGRAAFLERLRNRLLEELRSDPVRSPPSLKKRYLAWYPEAVVPLLEALSTSEPVLLELNKLTGRGVVEEGRAAVSAVGVGDFVEAPIPIPVQTWLNRFIRHEQLLLNAVERPCIDTLRGALQADPLVPSCKVEDCAQTILAGLDREAAERREHVRQAR